MKSNWPQNNARIWFHDVLHFILFEINIEKTVVEFEWTHCWVRVQIAWQKLLWASLDKINSRLLLIWIIYLLRNDIIVLLLCSYLWMTMGEIELDMAAWLLRGDDKCYFVSVSCILAHSADLEMLVVFFFPDDNVTRDSRPSLQLKSFHVGWENCAAFASLH